MMRWLSRDGYLHLWDRGSVRGRGTGLFVCHNIQTGSWPAQPLTQWVRGVKRPERQADHLLPPSTEVKNTWSYATTPHLSSERGALLDTSALVQF
jgi:hypothetical protein